MRFSGESVFQVEETREKTMRQERPSVFQEMHVHVAGTECKREGYRRSTHLAPHRKALGIFS